MYKSGSSYYNTQNKNDNYSNKVNNNSSRQNTYVQNNYKYNAYNTQNKNNNKYEYKPSYADSQRINTENNYKRYNQGHSINQPGSRGDNTPDLNYEFVELHILSLMCNKDDQNHQQVLIYGFVLFVFQLVLKHKLHIFL